MKTLIFHASPRKNQNTWKLLKAAERGAGDAGSDVVFVNLYDYTFQGCRSCFACKRKGNKCGNVCAVRDEITDLLHEAYDADVLIFGTPVYLHGASSQFRAFLERLLFPITSYSVDENGVRTRILKRTVRTGLIYSMNNGPDSLKNKSYSTLLGINGELLQIAYGHNEILYAFNTWQFDDYEKYEASLFNVEAKRRSRDEQFPKDLQAAYELGRRLAGTA